MNDNALSTGMGNNPTGQARLLTQSVRGSAPTIQQAPAQAPSATLKPGKTLADNRRGEWARPSESLSSSISFSVSTKKTGNIHTRISKSATGLVFSLLLDPRLLFLLWPILSLAASSSNPGSLVSVSIPSGQPMAPAAPIVTTAPPPVINLPARAEQTTKSLRANRPSVNSLMHLYGPWILDACLLQTKDRYSRSSTILSANDGRVFVSYRSNSCDVRFLSLSTDRNRQDLGSSGEAIISSVFCKDIKSCSSIEWTLHGWRLCEVVCHTLHDI